MQGASAARLLVSPSSGGRADPAVLPLILVLALVIIAAVIATTALSLMKIEPATVAHVAGIRALYDAMTHEDAVAFPRMDDHAFHMMDDLRCSNPQFVAVAPVAIQVEGGDNDRKNVVGWAIARRHAREPVAQLGIAIAAPWRRKGLGTAVFDAVICAAPRCGIHSIQLTVLKANKAAIALYSKFGFTREFEVDEDWAFMQRSLL